MFKLKPVFDFGHPPLLIYFLTQLCLTVFLLNVYHRGHRPLFFSFVFLPSPPCITYLYHVGCAPLRIFGKNIIFPNVFYFTCRLSIFYWSLSPSLTLAKPTHFEYICTQGPYQQHLISSLYKIFNGENPLIHAQMGICPPQANAIASLGQDMGLCF